MSDAHEVVHPIKLLVVCRANAGTYDSNKYIGVKYYNQLLITNLKQCLDACIILK